MACEELFVIPQNSAWQIFLTFYYMFPLMGPLTNIWIDKSIFYEMLMRYNNISIKIRLGLSESPLDLVIFPTLSKPSNHFHILLRNAFLKCTAYGVTCNKVM